MNLGDQWLFFQAVRRIPATQPSPEAMPAVKEQIADQIRDGKMQQVSGSIFAELQKKSNVVMVLGDEAKSRQHPGVAALINGKSLTMKKLGDHCIARHGEAVVELEINRMLLRQELRRAKKQVDESELTAEVQRAALAYGFVTKDGGVDVRGWLDAVTGGSGVDSDVYVADSVWPTVALKDIGG